MLILRPHFLIRKDFGIMRIFDIRKAVDQSLTRMQMLAPCCSIQVFINSPFDQIITINQSIDTLLFYHILIMALSKWWFGPKPSFLYCTCLTSSIFPWILKRRGQDSNKKIVEPTNQTTSYTIEKEKKSKQNKIKILPYDWFFFM